MRISDWSSDVCSSDLSTVKNTFATNPSKLMLASSEAPTRIRREISPSKTNLLTLMATRLHLLLTTAEEKKTEERRVGEEGQYGEIWGGAVSIKKKSKHNTM